MSNSAQMVENVKTEEQKAGTDKENLEGLPLQSSPYVKYTDLEDYKMNGYGTQGHTSPKPGQGGGATDAPTISGSSHLAGQATQSN
ncbi:hypothetical protein AQUCO_00700941v1 [Aquilegia coerulea]|uniref:Uncharacterized protein n=1 Tax=Aquilegia coerulea TaxID=218851 RepID=A0A2G5EMD7_AQUCA|nr:hypothetical protein AQUCO_00700941v1 [Aquilegia coerulea]